VKVPQNLELEDVIAWGLGAVDLVCWRRCRSWMVAIRISPGDLDIRVEQQPRWRSLVSGSGVMRFGDLALRDWATLAVQYALRHAGCWLGRAMIGLRSKRTTNCSRSIVQRRSSVLSGGFAEGGPRNAHPRVWNQR